MRHLRVSVDFVFLLCWYLYLSSCGSCSRPVPLFRRLILSVVSGVAAAPRVQVPPAISSQSGEARSPKQHQIKPSQSHLRHTNKKALRQPGPVLKKHATCTSKHRALARPKMPRTISGRGKMHAAATITSSVHHLISEHKPES